MKRAATLLPTFANDVQSLRESLLFGRRNIGGTHPPPLDDADFNNEAAAQHFLAALSFLELAQRQLNLAAITERKK